MRFKMFAIAARSKTLRAFYDIVSILDRIPSSLVCNLPFAVFLSQNLPGISGYARVVLVPVFNNVTDITSLAMQPGPQF